MPRAALHPDNVSGGEAPIEVYYLPVQLKVPDVARDVQPLTDEDPSTQTRGARDARPFSMRKASQTFSDCITEITYANTRAKALPSSRDSTEQYTRATTTQRLAMGTKYER